MDSSTESRLAKYGQQHLLQFADDLDPESRQRLLEQVDSIDFAEIQTLFQKFGKADAWAELAKRAEPPIALRLGVDATNSISLDDALTAGIEALSDGHVGMILVAGGQGSRLGFEHPKGMYPVSPVLNRTLFQIHIDKLRAINGEFDCRIPLYVMTSPATHQETVDFLQQNEWFGYPVEIAKVFCQGTMPAVDCVTGKVLLSAKDRLFASPDGHGGMLAALESSGCLEHMKSNQLQQIFYCQIDNPLCQTCDPATIGYHILAKSEMSSQAVPKIDALQKVGNIVSIDDKVHIIEYSDLPDDVAKRTTDDGALLFWAGNIAVHVFDVAFLDRMTGHADALPFHLAHKKVPYLQADGTEATPQQPNAIKFERFVFDLLPMASHSIVVEVDPDEAFSPVKNAASEKSNTAATARQAMIEQCRRLLNEVNVELVDGVAIEIDPSLMQDPEKLRQATAGTKKISEPIYLK